MTLEYFDGIEFKKKKKEKTQELKAKHEKKREMKNGNKRKLNWKSEAEKKRERFLVCREKRTVKKEKKPPV